MRANRFVLPAWGRGIFSPVYVENLVDGVLMVAGNQAAVGQVITISDGTGAQSGCLARAGTYSIAKARELLGYEPAIDLQHGMQLTEVWLREKGLL